LADRRNELGFHAFRDYAHTQAPDNAQQRADHFLARRGSLDAFDHALVELQVVRRDVRELDQPRLASAEVVVGELEAQAHERFLVLPHRADVGDAGLGDLEDDLMIR
jgi:hypothetical protein